MDIFTKAIQQSKKQSEWERERADRPWPHVPMPIGNTSLSEYDKYCFAQIETIDLEILQLKKQKQKWIDEMCKVEVPTINEV